ncbi:MAG: 50S ribosomal protein L28 [Candidatus Margulisiibacteriota bacterium]|jgi:large subunit ribosomal protein L28
MSRKCEVCGKKAMNSNLVSHSNIKTKTLQQPNLMNLKLLINGVLKKFKICTGCLKTHMKNS